MGPIFVPAQSMKSSSFPVLSCGYFLDRAGLVSWWLTLCHRAKKGSVEGVLMPIQQHIAILCQEWVHTLRADWEHSPLMFCNILSLYLVKAYQYKPLWNHTNPFIRVLLVFTLSWVWPASGILTHFPLLWWPSLKPSEGSRYLFQLQSCRNVVVHCHGVVYYTTTFCVTSCCRITTETSVLICTSHFTCYCHRCVSVCVSLWKCYINVAIYHFCQGQYACYHKITK